MLAFAVTGENIRLDWALGQPVVTDNATSACNDTTVARFDWVLGQPSVVYDATANCTLAAAEEGNIHPIISANVAVNAGNMQIRGGLVQIR